MERKHITLLVLNEEATILLKYSSCIKIQHVIAHCLRFSYNCKNSSEKSQGELEEARNKIIYMVQKETFQREKQHLIKHNIVHKSSNLRSLTPCLDSNQ